MSDISEIQVKNTKYTIKDKIAREDITSIENDLNDNYYTKTESNSLLNLKADKSEIPDVSNFITKDVDDLTNYTNNTNLATALNLKADKTEIPDVSNFITKDVNDLTNYTLTSNLSSVATSGSYNDLTNKPTIPPNMSILSYGNSTWNDFINAYNSNSVVYCRASSNSNPATGSQTRLAFMAYVNNATNPTEVEFQYYRSVSSHSDSQQGDQVFVYKLTSNGTWSVLNRNTFTKIIAGTNLSSSYSSGNLTLNNSLTKVSDLTNDSGFITKDVNNLTNYTDNTNLTTALNLKADKSEIADSGWINLTVNQGTWEYAKIRKIGKMVEIRAYSTSFGAPSGTVFTLPSGYAPNEYIYSFGANGWTTAPTLSRWVVTPTGTISIDWALSFVDGTNLTTNTWKRFNIIYMID